MKKYSLVFLFFWLFSSMILANGMNTSRSKFLVSHSKVHKHEVIVKLVPGSLKSNIERIASENGWHKVVWNAGDDYNWVAPVVLKERNLIAVMGTILKGYPLQAVFYQGNKVLVIEARTMR